MKLTKSRLKKIIREELMNEGIRDEYKQFQAEVGTTQSGWKKKMTELDQRQQSVNSIKSVHTAISEIINYFKDSPVSEALGVVKKSNVRKFEKALGVMESILEDTSGWLEENK